ncbi:MAG: bifunctional metallophosphatase/5'-nucleotidase [Chryseolinea sp.]
MSQHKDNCTCGCKSSIPEGVSRKDFLKAAGAVTIGLGLSPMVSLAMMDEGKAKEIQQSNTIKKGKAQKITLLHTTDIHGQINVHDEFFWEDGKPAFKKRGGFAHLKTMIAELRKQNPNTLLLDGGDCFQGSGVAVLTQGQAMIPLMNNLKYDLVLPGNWEVVYGKKILLSDLAAYNARKICANMFDDDEAGNLLFPPYSIFKIEGVKIGFIGYNDPLTPIRQSPDYSKGIKFTDPERNISKYIKILREQEQCKLVFVMSHMGLAQQLNLASQPYAEGVDYILGADTHERIREPLQGKYAKVTEPGAFASFIGKLDIVMENGEIKDESYELLDVDPERYKADEEMKQLVTQVYKPHEKELHRVIGKSKTILMRNYILETPMDNLITDALMWKFKTDITLSNGFRFGTPLLPDNKTGVVDITKDFLWSMLPVNSRVKTGDVTGQQIMNWLEKELENTFATDPTKRFGGWLVRFNGMQITITIGNEKGKRVQRVTIQGNPIEIEKSYTLTACERDGDPVDTLCRLTGIKNPTTKKILLHDVMEEYLSVFSPVSPMIEGRTIATDAPSTLLTQVTLGSNYQFR